MAQWTQRAGLRVLDAATRLAAQQPIHDLTVAGICQEAVVTRDTFYRYASSPIEALAQAMCRDLQRTTEFAGGAGEPADPGYLEASARVLVLHVDQNRAVYRNALHPHLDSGLRDILFAHVSGVLIAHAKAHPEIVPLVGGRSPSEDEVEQLAVFTASGVVGAIEGWTGRSEPSSADRLIEILFAAAATWWRQ